MLSAFPILIKSLSGQWIHVVPFPVLIAIFVTRMRNQNFNASHLLLKIILSSSLWSASGSASRFSPCLSVASHWESWVWQKLRTHERILLKLCLSFSTTTINHHYSILSRKVGEYIHAHFLGKWLINIIFHFYFCLNLMKKTQLALKRKHRNNIHIFFFFNDFKFVTFRKKFLSIQIYNVNRLPYSLSLLPAAAFTKVCFTFMALFFQHSSASVWSQVGVRYKHGQCVVNYTLLKPLLLSLQPPQPLWGTLIKCQLHQHQTQAGSTEMMHRCRLFPLVTCDYCFSLWFSLFQRLL